MAENPYQAPGSPLLLPANGPVLASRGNRLGGALLDFLIDIAIMLPLEISTGYWQVLMDSARAHRTPPYDQITMWGLVGMAVFLVVQSYPLLKDGQTWGKKMVGTRIVAMDGVRPSAMQLGLRYLPFKVIGAIPFVRLLVLVDVLMVYRGDKRCLHDLVAGTQVIDVSGEGLP